MLCCAVLSSPAWKMWPPGLYAVFSPGGGAFACYHIIALYRGLTHINWLHIMRLKLQSSTRQSIVTVDDDANVAGLLEVLKEQGYGDVRIKIGFPPRAVSVADGNARLKDVGIHNGEKLVLEEPSVSPIVPIEQDDTPRSSTPHVGVEDGYCVLRRVPDDNSCLFRSISYAVFANLEEGSQLRSVVADAIRDDEVLYSSAILGKEPSSYAEWIQRPNSWGGAIELQILAKHLGITIHSLDVEHGRIDDFNPGCSTFIVLLYSGIHYDTAAFTPLRDIDCKDLDVCVFTRESELGRAFIKGLRELGAQLNHKGYVTNTSTFKIKCNDCGTVLHGERDASEHASTHGHYNFGEV